MHKKITVLLFIIITSINTNLQAQDEIAPEKRLKGGFVSSQLFNTGWESSNTPGFTFGLSLDFHFTEAFSVQPEILYVEKGSREYLPSLDTEFNLTMDYLEIPVLAKYQLPIAGLVRPHVYLGPYAAILIENNSNINVMESSRFTPDKLIEVANTGEFGATMGVGTDIAFPFNIMSAEIRYSAGITDAFNSKTVSQTVRSGALMFLVGFQF